MSPLDAQDLQNTGLLSPPSPGGSSGGGSRRLHKRRLNRSSDEEHYNIPLDVPMQSPAGSHAFQEIPEFLISREALVHVGFSDHRAAFLWNEWSMYMAGMPQHDIDDLQVDFISFILNRLDQQVNTWSDTNSEWRSCLNSYGMSDEFQAAIMDPNFKYLRTSESCHYWTKDTVEMRFAGLQDIQRASRLREASLRQRSTQHGSSGAGPSHSRSGSAAERDDSSARGHRRNRTSSSIQRLGAPGVQLRTMGTASALAAANAPGCTMLFKGIDNARIHGLFSESGNLQDITVLQSSPPGDFSGNQSRYYFSPDYKVAEYYAAYAKRRNSVSAVCIVSLAIPNAALEQMQSTELVRIYWPSEEWKETVWLSRRRQLLPSRLAMVSQATVVIGTIAKRPDEAYHRIQSFNEITENYILKADRLNPSVQFVFHYRRGKDFLEQHAAQTMRVTPFVNSDLTAWLQANGSFL
ncbi:hypothetical protein CH35J_005326 [Colletotrichum higginsianum]|nr:hypothetical protein CH35J_005326 [Colletotrichum higginsianum]